MPMHPRSAHDPEHAPVALLRALVEASPASRQACLLRILAELEPEVVLSAGLALYRQSKQEWFLETIAAVMREFGPAAWHALAALCRQGPPEAYAFVSAVAECPSIDPEAREHALLRLASHSAWNVRERVLEAASVFDTPAQRRLLAAVRDASHDDLRIEAELRLALLDHDPQTPSSPG